MSERIVYYGSSERHREWMDRLKKILRIEVKDTFGGLEAAKKEALAGKGIVWVFSHNMKNDGIALISLLRSDPVFAEKDLLVPMSDSLFHDKKYKLGQKPLRTTFMPIVTPEVRAKKNIRHISETGLRRYLLESRNVLARGGMVAFAPQAQGNQDVWDTSNPTKAFSRFLHAMGKEGMGKPIEDFVIVPVGLSAPGAEKKGKPQKGSHFGKAIQVTIGKCTPLSEVLEQKKQYGDNADRWIYETIADLLPASAVKRT